MTEIDENIQKIYWLERAIEDKCADRDYYIHELQNERDQMAEPFLAEIAELKKIVVSDVINLEKSYKGPLGVVTFRKGSKRRSWDSDSLELYGTDHPEILDFKKVTFVKPNATIKMNE